MQQSKKAHSSESGQHHLTKVRQRVEELERRMNFKAQPLSEEEQDRLEARFRRASQMKRWPE